MFLKKRKLQQKEINAYNQLLQIHEYICKWYIGYYCGICLPRDYIDLLNELCEKEYLFAFKIYGEKAIKLTFANIEYLPTEKEILWWDMWGLSIFR